MKLIRPWLAWEWEVLRHGDGIVLVEAVMSGGGGGGRGGGGGARWRASCSFPRSLARQWRCRRCSSPRHGVVESSPLSRDRVQQLLLKQTIVVVRRAHSRARYARCADEEIELELELGFLF